MIIYLNICEHIFKWNFTYLIFSNKLNKGYDLSKFNCTVKLPKYPFSQKDENALLSSWLLNYLLCV